MLLRKPTVGFEFDVHYGPIPGRPDLIGSTLSVGLAPGDGFKVNLDGPRLEVNTRPFETTAAGKKEIEDTAVKIKTFTDALASGCGTAGPTSGFAHPQLSVPVGSSRRGRRPRTARCGRRRRRPSP